jgi:D-glycero-alpha-D-manno-heptose 1-phosphate guanylyltransferase
MNIFILAGGLGTRLQSVVKDIPKPMADINGTPFLDYIIDNIRSYFKQASIYLLTYHLSEYIEQYYKDDPLIQIIKEPKKLGTGGAIKHALQQLNLPIAQPVLILNGDTYSNINFKQFIEHHTNSDLTIGVTKVNNSNRYGSVEINNHQIKTFKEKSTENQSGHINIGTYFIPNTKIIHNINQTSFAFEDQLSNWAITNNMTLTPFYHTGPFIDIGIPEDYQKMIDFISRKQ